MYNVTEKYKNQVKKLPQNYRMEVEVIFDVSTEGISLKTENGETLTTEIGDILEFPAPGSMHIPANDIFDSGFAECVFLSSFAVGTSVRPNWWVRINNKGSKYKNNAFASAEFHPRFILYDNDGNITDTVPIGIYFTDKITIQGSDLHIACFDKMAYTEKLFVPTGTDRTLYEIALGIALDVRSVLINTPQELPILSLIVNDTIFSGYSKKQVLELIACVSGSFVQFDNDGNLVFKWFTHSGVELNGDNSKSPLSLNGNTFSLDGNPVKVTGVSIVYEDSELARIGTDDYLLTINENPIAANYPDEVAEFILNRLKDTIYIPCEWNRIGGDPALQLGDIVTIIDNKEPYNPEHHDKYNKYPLYMTSRSWRYNCGGFSDVYKASGNAEKDLNTDKGMTLSKRTSKLAKRITETKKDLTEDMDKRQEFLLMFNETVAASMGFYSTVVEDDSGAVVQYMHDKPELADSKTIYTKGINGFAWTNDGWNNGNPVWQYGFDKNGNAILNQIYAYNLTADVIVSGLLKSKNGASWINLDDGTFQFGNSSLTPKLKLDTNGDLLVDGVIRRTYGLLKTPFSIYVGSSLTDSNRAAFTITDGYTGYGELLQVERAGNLLLHGKGTEISVPFLRSGSNVERGVGFYKDGTSVYANNSSNNCYLDLFPGETNKFDLNYNQSCGVKCDGTNVILYVRGNEFQLLPSGAYTGGDMEVNGSVSCTVLWESSDREKKENIKSQDKLEALEKINSLKFYSYDFKENKESETLESAEAVKFNSASSSSENSDNTSDENEKTPIHIDLGIIADEAPSEILSPDGKKVNIYSFIALTAKAVQQLADKVEALEKRVEDLEKENQILKEENL